jgi:hypothetical protein
MQASKNDSYDLVMGTVDVLNQAVEKHRDTPVLGKLVDLMGRATSGQRFGVAVYKDDPDSPFDYYTLRFNQGRFEFVARGKDEPDVDWKVSQSYLQSVCANPQEYIDNPAKLDLDWLKSRFFE